ncbi:MAG: radical SAM family heme chaperone HemW [Anaerolineae bacterium]|nr:radical SAM family heme chaperone HemW [Anaerolineae bacterium]
MSLMTNTPISIYLHIPFCTTKCTYCAFNTYTHLETLIPAFVEALIREIQIVADGAEIRLPAHSVFFGGGTPTLLTPAQLGQILDTLHQRFEITSDAEITTEANPNDLNLSYLQGLRAAGFNRLSIGMQSANAQELKLFARRHDYATVTEIMPLVRQAEFKNVNLDLIYGAPYQSLATWHDTLTRTLELAPEHISLYALGLEENTPLKEWVETGRVPTPDDDLAADMYELATELLGVGGYQQYEISNWSQPGQASRHNLQYWRNWPYLGLGPGAHGYANGVRYATLLSPQRYIKALQTPLERHYPFPSTPATVDEVQVDRANEIAETLIMGLRLTVEGIDRAAFQQRFGVDLVDLHHEVITKYQTHGLLEVSDSCVRITQQGRMLSNLIFRDLV